MALIETTLGAPLYTLICIDWSTKQKTICTYGTEGAILTSNKSELLSYARTLQFHVTDSRYYYIANVSIIVPKDAYFERDERDESDTLDMKVRV